MRRRPNISPREPPARIKAPRNKSVCFHNPLHSDNSRVQIRLQCRQGYVHHSAVNERHARSKNRRSQQPSSGKFATRRGSIRRSDYSFIAWRFHDGSRRIFALITDQGQQGSNQFRRATLPAEYASSQEDFRSDNLKKDFLEQIPRARKFIRAAAPRSDPLATLATPEQNSPPSR